MSIKTAHHSRYGLYFCTFTCYIWTHLFEITQSYDCVYKWFVYLAEEKNIGVVCYVIMPNHVHIILHLPDTSIDLNEIIGNGKRFMAYEIIKRLEAANQTELLETLHCGVTVREAKKGQVHKVFEESFDAKPIYSDAFLFQKIDYIHHNPVRGKWNLVEEYTDFPHSSAAFYRVLRNSHTAQHHGNQ